MANRTVKVRPGHFVEDRAKAQKLADKTGQPVDLMNFFQIWRKSGKLKKGWTYGETVRPKTGNPRRKNATKSAAASIPAKLIPKKGGGWRVMVAAKHARRMNPEKWTIAKIRAANHAAGYHFFDRKTMQFFKTKIASTVYQGPGGIYFVTSEQYGDASRIYKVRKFNDATSSISSGEDFRDKENAKIKARMMAR